MTGNGTCTGKIFVFLATVSCVATVNANPVLDNVAAGNVTVQQNPGITQVNQSSQNAIINWQSFNISTQEKTQFVQPNASSVALNRISPNQGASQIYGQLTANGRIILVNQAGIYFGPGSRVDVGGIIASTSDITNANFLAGKYIFDQASPYAGSVINEGTIRAANYGLVALVGTGVRNDGTIQARSGNIVLASGNKFTFDLYGDQLVNFSVDAPATTAGVDQNGKKLSDGVKNTGALLADGGTIIMSARAAEGVVDNAVNMQGVAQARSVSKRNGVIILDGGDGTVSVAGTMNVSGKRAGSHGGTVKILAKHVRVHAPTVIDASGDAGGGTVLIGGNEHGAGPEYNAADTYVDSGVVINANAITHGNGGKVIVWSDNDTRFHGSISAQGGALSGDGGFVETSGHYLDVDNIKINLL
jgi:filamentous hemagglutinin family protein